MKSSKRADIILSTGAKKVNFGGILFMMLILTIVIIAAVIVIIETIKNPAKYSVQDKVLFSVVIACCISVVIYVVANMGKDRMTGIPNQDGIVLFAIAKMIKKELSKYTSIYINIKDFKYINRLIGNGGGDRILIKYSREIKRYLTKGERVGRLGGDNFIVLMYKHRVDDFLLFLKNVEFDVSLNGVTHNIKVDAKCGIYALSEKDTVGDAINYPSLSYNYSKTHNGVDNCWFQPFMAQELYEENEIAYMFAGAVEREEFKVYYQPKINIDSNVLSGCEALVRWERNGMLIPPMEFVPALERCRLVEKLDFYVLEQVCKDLRRWLDAGLNVVPVSSNFTKIHLQDKYFSRRIIEIINKYDLDRSLFEIELTESASYDNTDELNRFLDDMHAAGIDIAIDDFGIGYSSFELLKNLNVDVIKLDKSFIDNIENDNGDNINALLVKNLVHTCHDLKKNIVCEGIENEAQKNIIASMRCHVIQGYLYDEPLSAKDFEVRLKNPNYAEIA